MTLIDDYLEYQIKYEKKYGKFTIVLMQVGHFYEAYGIDNKEEQTNNDNLKRLSDILNIQLTKKNKNILEITRGNPLMMGVNIFSIDKFIQLLINNNYTTIIIDQVTPPPEPERAVTNIYSPGTNIKHSIKGDTNNLVSIYIESVTNLKKFQDRICIGLSSIDLSTGNNFIFETYSNLDDSNLALDEVFRFIQMYDPKEIVIHTKNLKLSKNFITSYLDLSHRVCHYYDDILDGNYTNIKYQDSFLKKIFTNTGLLSVIEYLDLEHKIFGLVSYMVLLDFAYEHNETIIQKINKPELYNSEKKLILTNNCINQINVIPNIKLNINNKFDSLFGVINNTSTSIGKRYLRERILNPILDIDELNKRYSLVDSFMYSKDEQPLYKQYEVYLNRIIDIERLHRKLSLKYIHPADFVSLDLSYENIINILNIENNDIKSILPSELDIKNFKNFVKEYTDYFDMDEIVKYHLDKISKSFFRKGHELEIDDIQEKIDKNYKIIKLFCLKLSNYIENNSKYIKLEHNDRDGHYLAATTKRCNLLKQKFSNMNYHNFSINLGSESITINPKDIEFKTLNKSNTKINYKLIKEISNELRILEDTIKTVCKEVFIKKMEYFDNKYGVSLKTISKFVGEIDLIKSVAKTSINYGYTRPKIQENDHSFINAKGLRHPIIERIQTDIEYVPNDIILGEDNTNGILLFGTNASGKSSLMKSIGLNVILAQAGMFVAANSFVYNPYQYLFSRINNNDNIFKGESSFAVEMGELRSILKRANKHSLVLGDELCSGTESISAQSIFASSVLSLSKKNINFIFATHLHELCNIECIKQLSSLKIFHLKVIFDEIQKTLIYDRKLEEGSGPAIYGLEVCRAMDMDKDFLDTANIIRKDLMNINNRILEPKKSVYNNEVFVDICMVCNAKAMDVHHIKFQCQADSNNMIGTIPKDIKSNLVPLCKACHISVHNHDLEIYGYQQTSDGIKLNYSKIDKKTLIEKNRNRKKISDIQLEVIKELRLHTPNITQKLACNLLKKNHNLDISCATLSKIWRGIY